MPQFFEKLKKGIDKGVTTVSVKSKEMLEVSQLRSQIKSLQEEKQRGLEELGSIVYTLYRQGTLELGTERIQAKCGSLAALDQRIREKEEEIHQVQLRAQEALGKTVVPSVGVCECGAPVYEGAKFCGGCGKEVAEALSRPGAGVEAAESRCPQCGAALASDGRLCGVCGTKAGPERT